MNDHTILYLPCFDFEVLPQRPQQLLWTLADEGFKVIYCNVTQKPKTEAFSILKPGFTLCHNIEALDREQSYIMWWTHGPYMDKLPDYNLCMLVSDIADASVEEFGVFNDWHRYRITLADLVFCASRPIFEEACKLNPHTYLIRNGVNPGFFEKARNTEMNLPEEMAKKLSDDRLIVGFWGAVATWLDYELLHYLAESRPEYTYLMIGPVNSEKAVELANQHQNIIFTGYRPYSELPSWARHFKAGLIPFQVREVTRSANPIKMYEYLASGLPVIATDIPEARECSLVKIASTKEQYLKLLDEAVQTAPTTEEIQQRLDYSWQQSWQARASQIAAAINSLLPETTPRLLNSWTPPVVSKESKQHSIWERVWGNPVSDWDSLSENILNVLKNWTGDCNQLRILEVGCGSGKISARLASMGAEVHLLDYSEKALKVAKERFDHLTLKGAFKLGDMMRLPFEPDSFDLVWSSGVLEHYLADDQEKAIREMARVCRNNGKVINLVMNAACLPYRLGKWTAEKTGCWPWGEEYPVNSLIPIYLAAGLTTVAEETFDFETGADFLAFLPNGSQLMSLVKDWYHSLSKTNQKLFGGYLLAIHGTVEKSAPNKELSPVTQCKPDITLPFIQVDNS